MRGLVLVAGLSVFGCLPAGSATADDNQNLAALCAGPDANRAISACTDLLKAEGQATAEKAGVLTWRAAAYLKAGHTFYAMSDCDSAIELKPDAADAFRVRGQVQSAIGDDARAIADYTKAIALNPTSAEAFKGRADAYARKGDNDHALGDYTRALGLNREYVEALNNRANIYLQEGDSNNALSGYEDALAINPD